MCAIAIGLSASPKVLGRQKELKDFIKRGQEEAEIEITLYPNYRITRTFWVNENNRCETRWKINSKRESLLSNLRLRLYRKEGSRKGCQEPDFEVGYSSRQSLSVSAPR